MHPALSIIVFTTASGLGYGLAAVLGLGLLDPLSWSTKIAHVLALLLIGGGLISSTLHLGNPQRAWRALSQWRTSWLSREGVMALVTFVPLTLNAFSVIFLDRHLIWAGLAGTVLAAVTVYCTAMIYASLKAIDAWHTPLTPASYLLFSGAGGALAASLFAASGTGPWAGLAIAGMLLLVAAWAVKLAWRNRLQRRPRSTPETATGLGAIGKVRLFEPPHINDNYLTSEMGFRIARKHASKLFRIAFAAGLVAPLILAFIALFLPAGGAMVLLALAVLAFGAGVMVERWLFFAEARHAVMNYY
ncbi:dimethyl sulfoxide reductase anchor subunit [Chelativorans sp. ZYF759]|uniref:dimethyl sulfoxide reductase anchor subunit family protein n=1 Tax=Chelativorans sp. ZYF759 TaxID=2692213 RepID=UPI00145C7A0D|nr:DmsC/YnfH family molybdoenzyme membrane anchor subunit [Chelativorans sp. ZYF759]NMG38772.1 dimethyl sulfoxide reductase anchor subunit [Chelativorans sp. ZYF759]